MWLLYPGQRTRQTALEDFIETSIDSCDIVETDAPHLVFLLARMDSVSLICADNENYTAKNSAVLET